MPRPRTARKPNLSTRLPDLKPTAHPATLLPARADWLQTTREAYEMYAKSQEAGMLHDVDSAVSARFLFDVVDKRDRMWSQIGDEPTKAREAILAVKSLQMMVSTISRELGINPRARRDLGVTSDASPMSRLEKFRRHLPTEDDLLGPAPGDIVAR